MSMDNARQMPLAPVDLPLAGVDIWEQVMTRADYQCQCKRCPSHKRKGDGRCVAGYGAEGRLLTGPLDPGPDPLRRVRSVLVDQLLAWCSPCWDSNVKATRALYAHVATRALRERADTLF
jgi:hypothetical protein